MYRPLVYRANNLNSSGRFGCRAVVARMLSYSKKINGIVPWHRNRGKKKVKIKYQVGARVPGYSSKWHYPAGRVGSGLQKLAGTRFWRVPAGSYLYSVDVTQIQGHWAAPPHIYIYIYTPLRYLLVVCIMKWTCISVASCLMCFLCCHIYRHS